MSNRTVATIVLLLLCIGLIAMVSVFRWFLRRYKDEKIPPVRLHETPEIITHDLDYDQLPLVETSWTEIRAENKKKNKQKQHGGSFKLNLNNYYYYYAFVFFVFHSIWSSFYKYIIIILNFNYYILFFYTFKTFKNI